MQQPIFDVKKVRPGAVIPLRATEQSAGYDLFACLEEPLLLRAHQRACIPTGIAIAITALHTAGFVFGRSGLGVKQGICPSNAVGVIDADYRGEIMVGLTNHSDDDYTIAPGERIAQLLFMPYLAPKLRETDTLDATARGTGGFGSSGK